MSVSTMVAEPESSFNRRRVRGPTQIYRPPPARNTRTNEVSPRAYDNNYLIQQQQQYLEALKEYQSNIPNKNVNRHYPNDCYNSPTHDSGGEAEKQRSRRPDQQFYVPRRRRGDDLTPCGTPTPYDECPRGPSPTNSICSVVSEYSGRNRYKHGRSNRLSFQEDDSRVYNKPPMSSFSRESTPVLEKGRPKPPNLFASQTLQLIERCINHDGQKPLNGSPSWENSPNKGPRGGRNTPSKDFAKSPKASRDNHPVHSKENFMHPIESNNQNQRSRKGKRNRRRGSKSRDHSQERRDGYVRRGSVSTDNLNRTYYNSNADPFERHNFNHERTASRNSSRASSRNPSIERNPADMPTGYEWRVKGYSNPTSPVKTSPPALDQSQRRHSLGKPPSGKGALAYNVHVDPKSPPASPTRNAPPELEVKDSKTQIPPESELDNSLSPVSTPLDESVESQMKEYTSKLNELSLNASQHDESFYSANESLSCAPSEDVSLDTSRMCSPSGDSQESNSLSSESPAKEEEESEALLSVSFESSKEEGSCPVTPTEEEAGSIITEVCPDETPNCGETSESPEESDPKEDSPSKAETSPPPRSPISTSSPTVTEDANPKKFSFNWADEVDQVAGEDSWDNLYEGGANSLPSSVKDQLEDAIGKIKLEKPSHDYLEFKPQERQISDERYGNIIEIYDFPSTFQTQDLMTVFQEFKDFDLKWVDDTHALGIFTTILLASDCLGTEHPFVKTRPLSKATEASKSKAIRVAERLPFKARPQTSVALARRLVSGALGLKVQVSKEQREAERQKLKDAKEKKKLIAKQKEDAWEGTICNQI